jgi:hypothetical protein
MTENNGKYYCDICKDDKPIPKGTGFSFPKNPLGIEHSHQTCYFEKQKETKVELDKDASKAYMKFKGINLSQKEVNDIVDSNIQYAKNMVEEYRRKQK